MPTLFDPVEMGLLMLPNRILMAPLTRGRATKEAVPTPVMVEYYAQRAEAGLIISEATGISRIGLGWPYAPGLWNDAQVEGWKPVVDAVHAAGGRIVAQLWHMGRLVHPSVGGGRPVSPSATTAPSYAHTYEGKQPYVEAHALTPAEIKATVADYARAARNAIRAGFDGVQIHGANGYLVDQFLRDGTNLRTDEYGGPVENRLRFMREVVEAVSSEAGIGRTGIRFSPNGEVQGCNDSDNHSLFTAAAAELEKMGVPWLELREPGPRSTFRATDEPAVSPSIRKAFSGTLVLNSDYDGTSAQAKLDEGIADAISFGRPFIANPDLVDRIREGSKLNRWDVATFYTQGREGYADYPTRSEQEAA
jgi:2,4-dienoyl-CoA reductase-like NADH-dependent reductase (Old Yellow Enzyme family)